MKMKLRVLIWVLDTVSVFVCTHMHWLHYFWRFGKKEWVPDTYMLDHGLFMYVNEKEYLRRKEWI